MELNHIASRARLVYRNTAVDCCTVLDRLMSVTKQIGDWIKHLVAICITPLYFKSNNYCFLVHLSIFGIKGVGRKRQLHPELVEMIND